MLYVRGVACLAVDPVKVFVISGKGVNRDKTVGQVRNQCCLLGTLGIDLLQGIVIIFRLIDGG